MNNIFGWSSECQSNKLIPAVFNDLNDFMSSVETAADLEGIPHRQYVVGLTSNQIQRWTASAVSLGFVLKHSLA